MIELTPAQWVETLTALALFAGAVLLALLLPVLVTAIVHRRTRMGRGEVTEIVVRALRGPFGLLVVVQALFISLSTLSYLEAEWQPIGRAWLATTIAVFVYAAQRVATRLLQWYADRAAPLGTTTDAGAMAPRRRAVNAVIWIVGGLVVLDTLGVQISPLLAGLGLGGLAVALALQPMLANVFASTYLLADHSIRVGDAIEVQAGPSGVIEDIGWRATRIRTAERHLVIVPNSVLAQATFTNLEAASGGADVVLRMRIPATADLAAAERICLEVAALLRADAAAQVLEGVEPTFRYRGVEAGRAEFELRLRAASHREVGDLRHRLILGVQRQLAAAGIRLA